MNEQQLLELKLTIRETEKKIDNLKEEFEQDYDPEMLKYMNKTLKTKKKY